MSQIDVALAYASRGWPVFPCEPRGKQPLGRLVPHGLKEATTDADQIRAWWTEEPEANIGLLTGVAFDVADFDSDEAIAFFLAEATAHQVEVRAYPRVQTGGGGRHVLVAPTGLGNRAKFLPGTDWRGKDGYIVAPGSVHPSGVPYRWLREPNGHIPAAPDFLLEVLRRPEPPASIGPGGPAPEAYVDKALADEMAILRSAPVGQRNDQLNRSAFALGQMVGAGWLDQGRAEAELRAAAYAIDHGREPGLTATIRSGLESGKRDPRQVPPGGFTAAEIRQSPPAPAAESSTSTEVSTTASKVSIRPIKWLWPGRLPLGMLTGFDGDPERGKSQHLALMAAHITTGTPWPDGSPCPQGGVIMVGAEDSREQVVVPRLMAAGADLSRIELVSTLQPANRLLTIPEDIPILEALARRIGALMIAFDPLSAFLSDTVNANSEHDVRRALTPLAEMLDRLLCNAVALRHLSKNDKVGNALYRGLGSIGFNALARTTLAVAKDKEIPDEFIFATIKNNVGRKPKPQRYRIESVQVTPDIEVSQIVWGAVTEESPEDLMVAFPGKRPRREAKELLIELLSDGPVDSKLIFEAADNNQIAKRTLDRAKADLGIVARKVGYQGSWEWSLPPDFVPPKVATENVVAKERQIFGEVDFLNSERQRPSDKILATFDSEEPSSTQRPPMADFTQAPLRDASARESGRKRIPCPECGGLAYSAGPSGPPERKCHKCNHAWVPA